MACGLRFGKHIEESRIVIADVIYATFSYRIWHQRRITRKGS